MSAHESGDNVPNRGADDPKHEDGGTKREFHVVAYDYVTGATFHNCREVKPHAYHYQILTRIGGTVVGMTQTPKSIYWTVEKIVPRKKAKTTVAE